MGEAAALIAAFTWSGSSVLLTQVAARTPSVVVSAFRLTTAALILPLILLLTGEYRDIGSASALAIFSMVGSGLVGYGCGDTLYIRSLGLLGMQRAFTVSMTLFIGLTVAGGIVLLDEPFAWQQAAGAVLIAAGIYAVVRRNEAPPPPRSADAGLAVSPPVPFEAGEGEHGTLAGGLHTGAGVATAAVLTRPVLAGTAAAPARARPGLAQRLPLPTGAAAGYLLIVAVGILWATATLWLAAGRGSLGSIAAATLRTPAGAAGLLTFLMLTSPRALAQPFSDRRVLVMLVILGIFGSALGSSLYVYAVGEAGAARTTLLSAVSPLMALPLSVIFLHEHLRPLAIAGTFLCVAGIALVVV